MRGRRGRARQGNRTEAEQVLAADPGLPARLTTEDHRALIEAADHGRADAVQLMPDLGFPLDTRAAREDNGATALHAAAAAGSPATIRLLLARGADLEARDTTWDDTPLGWAVVGSGLRLGHDQAPDWVAAVRASSRPAPRRKGSSSPRMTRNRRAPKSPACSAPTESPAR
jgi:Ankyrin repeats (3 copies)